MAGRAWPGSTRGPAPPGPCTPGMQVGRSVRAGEHGRGTPLPGAAIWVSVCPTVLEVSQAAVPIPLPWLQCWALTLGTVAVPSAGSGTAKEEHNRVPGGYQHPQPRASPAQQQLCVQQWHRHLEEPCCQPLQWLLRLRDQHGLLWAGMWDAGRGRRCGNCLWLCWGARMGPPGA